MQCTPQGAIEWQALRKVGLAPQKLRHAQDASMPPSSSIPSVPDHVVRTVTENSRTLKLESHGFERE